MPIKDVVTRLGVTTLILTPVILATQGQRSGGLQFLKLEDLVTTGTCSAMKNSPLFKTGICRVK
jgi:hypothetical protein